MKGDTTIRVVIADDEPICKMDLSELLKDAGYDVVGEASDGFDAVEICRKLHPELILLDIKMPLLDGLSAAKIIHEEGLAETIILMTAYSEREFIEQAKGCGVGGYLVKPIDEKSLIPNIEVVVNRSREMGQLRRDIEKGQQSPGKPGGGGEGQGPDHAAARNERAGGLRLYPQTQPYQASFHEAGGRNDSHQERGLMFGYH